MKNPSKLHAWLPVLALALATAAAAPAAQAQNSYGRRGPGAPPPPLVDFQYRPQWATVTSSNVLMVRASERPNYDMFSYGSNFYIYNNGYWYRSNRWDGSYAAIDMRDVPTQIHDVPSAEWRSYPSGWANNNGNTYNNGGPGAPPPPLVDFQYRPQWTTVTSSNVLMVRASERPNYDMFSYGSNFYIYNNGYWYRSSRWDGSYAAIDMRDVPTQIHDVPAVEWRSYPSGWAYNNGNNGNTYNNGNGNNGNPHYDPRNQNNGYYDVSRAPAPPRVYFRHNPRWTTVSGTRVLMLNARDRQDYDIFRYGSAYYVYDNGYWYRSSRLNGTFVVIDQRSVPSVFQQVPVAQWRNYPPNWTTNTDYRYRRTVRTHTR